MAHETRCMVLATVVAFGMLGGIDAAAQTTLPDCTGPEHRQFDFWVGDWEVTAQGGVAGTNLVTLRDDGCVLHEHWKGAQGGTGESWNFFDRSTGLWHQIWIDGTGGVLRFSGRYADGRLALSGESRAPDGSPVMHKLTFYDNTAESTVKQVWEQSRDGGSTWKVVFDGLYRKRN
ncbi:MAG TPA: hypothetical protein VK845_13220 [Gemmatimonadales bacterium]|nr:hypothetical protein [Gemmatimonadales bacterium]